VLLSSSDLSDGPFMPVVMTTLGDTPYGGSSGVTTRLAGNTASAMCVYTQTGTGTASAAPAWTSTTGTPGSVVLSGYPTLGSGVKLNAAVSASPASADFSTGGTLRWSLLKDTTPETGATAGSDFELLRYSDAGSNLGVTMQVTRSSGNIAFEAGKPITGGSFNGITGLATATPLMDGTGAVGTATLAAREDHVHPSDTGRQAVNSKLTAISGLANAVGALINNGSGVFSYSAVMTNPMTTLGDTLYGGASGAVTRLAGYTTSGTAALTQTGTGSASAAPVWTSAVSTATASTLALRDGSAGLAVAALTATTGVFSGQYLTVQRSTYVGLDQYLDFTGSNLGGMRIGRLAGSDNLVFSYVPVSTGIPSTLFTLTRTGVVTLSGSISGTNVTASSTVTLLSLYMPLSTGTVGLFGTVPTTQKTVTGSKASNAALASLLTALAGYGLVVDSST